MGDGGSVVGLNDSGRNSATEKFEPLKFKKIRLARLDMWDQVPVVTPVPNNDIYARYKEKWDFCNVPYPILSGGFNCFFDRLTPNASVVAAVNFGRMTAD